MRIADLPLVGQFFDREGQPTKQGALMLRTVNDIKKRTGGILGEALGPLPSYTVTTLPDAEANARCLIYVSNGTSNKRLAVSDGTDWRFPDGNVVS